jgi:predicted metal-binding membrane protein
MTGTRIDRAFSPGDFAFYGFNGLFVAAGIAVTFYFIHSMPESMPMPGGHRMSMMWMRMPGQSYAASLAIFMTMWLAMMVAMMLPSAMPMLQKFRRTVHSADVSKSWSPGISTAFVGCGYFIVWMAAGALTYFLGTRIASTIMDSAKLSSSILAFSGAALILSGCFQFSFWKRKALSHCRDPRLCLAPGSQVAGKGRAFLHGLSQGFYCAVCCGGLMLALVVLGVMNPLVMFAVALIIALEKFLPKPQPVVYLTGITLITTGLVMLLGIL